LLSKQPRLGNITYLIRCVHVCTMLQQMFNNVDMSIPGCPKQSLKQNFTSMKALIGFTLSAILEKGLNILATLVPTRTYTVLLALIWSLQV
jgi:hypothetical protein